MSQIILVASGKGGSGKSSFVTGVGRALTSLGKKVLAIDCDVGLRSLDIMFDVTEKVVFDWGDLLLERCNDKGYNIPCQAMPPTETKPWTNIIEVGEINNDLQHIEIISSIYSECDYEYFLKCARKGLYFSDLDDIEKEFNIYIVDCEQFIRLQLLLCQLKIDYKNLESYEAEFAKIATRKI
jgi:cellulose biosynthesis protein BcsQ